MTPPPPRPAGAAHRRLLVVNPNANPAVTARVRRAAEAVIAPGTDLTVVNSAAGPFSIETAAERAAAEALLPPLFESHMAGGFDACVLACFDDIALAAARTLMGIPVVGACEAGFAAARTVGSRFCFVTTVDSAVPTIRALLARYGASGIAGVRAAGIGVAEAAAAGAAAEFRLVAAIRDAIDLDRADAILLGSGGLAGRADDLSRLFAIPVIDAVAAAVKMAEGLACLGIPRKVPAA